MFNRTLPRLSLRIGYIPEHFSTPISFAAKHPSSLPLTLIPQPLGTGALITQLKAREIDIAVGLTEGFVGDLSRGAGGYRLIGTYVNSPLCWGVSVRGNKGEHPSTHKIITPITNLTNLKGKIAGVSRLGSGSHIMSSVLAQQHGWGPFEVAVIGDFASLRSAVNDGKIGFFMWEYWTTKKYWDDGSLQYVGRVETPWPSWVVAARDGLDPEVGEGFLGKLRDGVRVFRERPTEAIGWITTELGYGEQDARAWMKDVMFEEEPYGVDEGVVRMTVDVLKKAGVVGPGEVDMGFYTKR
ncbi:periplasmic binding protein-like II [Piedraia hortae CBS 480.64]|uniref:Periplasmic binding protein-like II n=1 Tax=Piedraia hortae CBS 480.64 TaxID=1314780 RepID=A0A6A7BV96_9PEZI|nr:periplasmic binding protein-like II [Piedraia hortae CBS 480.64]